MININSQELSRCYVLLTVLMLSVLAGCDKSPSVHEIELSGETMGTYYRISIVSSEHLDTNSLTAQVDAILDDINSQMSTYINDSQISQFNRYQDNDWYQVSADLMRVSQKAKEIFTQTEGYFDPTIGPLVNLWSFGPENKPVEIPKADQLALAMQGIGADKLQIQSDPPAIKKTIAELTLDLSAIAKSYAVDKLSEILIQQENENFLIDIGGELRSRGKNISGQPWQVGIEKPQAGLNQSVHEVIAISDKSIATSGSYRNYFEKDNVRYSHIIDPQSGFPIKHKLVSVSVIADDCMTADAYATALMVLGPQKGYDFALQYGLAVYMIEKKGDDLISIFTPQMKPFLE